MSPRWLFVLALMTMARPAEAQVLDKRALMARQTWWDNRDFDWFAARIPAFESPDTAIDATYYYRWELLTKHLTYGSPATGYTFTEFLDRPFWSGAYGAISCPLGHQFAEVRWLDDRRIVDDFARYWFETPGAQPRSYSNWYGDAMWGTYAVLGDTSFLRAVLPYMRRQYDGWVAEHWDAGHGMFRWDGLHDGMERNINSRLTSDIDEGAEGYRPTLNSYMYADARAIARASLVFGDTVTAREFANRAAAIKARVQDQLWDDRRGFFLHQFARDERTILRRVPTDSGAPAPDSLRIRARTRTYDSGPYSGDAHGRELIGYVPWQFDLPDAGRGYERAWRLLMDTAYFASAFGPTTTERHDPQFYISPKCCWWSGNSWPYATTQTLVAMANLLNDYSQSIVAARDWMSLFETYTRTQRKDGAPYIAEGANPDNGSWAGFDTPGHSNHYFHSAYIDLVITGVVGLRPRADDSVEVHPLAPETWPWFALDDVRYHGHRLSIIWDRDGSRYRRGRGLTVLSDGRVIGRAPRLGRLAAPLGAPVARARPPRLDNVAVHNDTTAYPRITASFADSLNDPRRLVDGNYWYHVVPPNRWTTLGSRHPRDTVTIDLGARREIRRVSLYFLDDGDSSRVRAPAGYAIQVWTGTAWRQVSPKRTSIPPTGHRATVVEIAPVSASRARVILVPRPGKAVGLTEIELWANPASPR